MSYFEAMLPLRWLLFALELAKSKRHLAEGESIQRVRPMARRWQGDILIFFAEILPGDAARLFLCSSLIDLAATIDDDFWTMENNSPLIEVQDDYQRHPVVLGRKAR